MTKRVCLLRFLLLTTFIIASSGLAHGMVGGSLLNQRERESLGSVFSINSRVPGGLTTGVATHIGDGLLLTAYHVPCASPDAALIIKDLSGKAIGVGDYQSIREVQISHPEFTDTINAGLTVPLPDIAILRFPDEIREQIRQYPVMYLDTKQSLVNGSLNVPLQLVGTGLTSFGPPGLEPHPFQIGEIRLSGIDPKLGYVAEWKPGDTSAVGRPGDSGGPLLKKSQTGEWVQVGIASLVTKQMNQERTDVMRAATYFTPLNTKIIRLWLKGILSTENAPYQLGCGSVR